MFPAFSYSKLPFKTGFTLIEILVVISIIAVLASIIISSLGESRQRATEVADKEAVRQVKLAMELYALDHGDYPWPENYDGNIIDSTFNIEAWQDVKDKLIEGGYIKSIPSQPQRFAYIYTKTPFSVAHKVVGEGDDGGNGNGELPFGPPTVTGTIYYIDFDSGVNSNSGISTNEAWKHSPGDPQATGNPASVTLQPGDLVQFRGGVQYRGNLIIQSSGTSEQPIVYAGTGWGDGKAIIDGSTDITSQWVPCQSAADCGNNPNWQNIWYTTAPDGLTLFTPLFEDEEFLWFSQAPNPDSRLFHDNTDNFFPVPLGALTRTSVTDPANLTQSNPNFWSGAFVAGWYNPNRIQYARVTSFNPATNTLHFEDAGLDPYNDRDTFYSIINHLSILNEPGEYAHDPVTARLYIWPRGGNPNNSEIAYSVRDNGISIRGGNHVHIDGFIVQKYFAGPTDFNRGSGIIVRDLNVHSTGVVIRNNVVRLLRSVVRGGAIRVQNSDNVTLEGNHVYMAHFNRGLMMPGLNHIIKDNVVEYISGTGLSLTGAGNAMVTGNIFRHIGGSHANAVSVYQTIGDVHFEGNILTDASPLFTFRDLGGNLTVRNNLMYGNGTGRGIQEWANPDNHQVTIENNTVVGIMSNNSLVIGSYNASYLVRNNILDGASTEPSITFTHNLYVGLVWRQAPSQGWVPAEGEIIELDWNKVFVNPNNNNYRLRSDSPAVDSGTPLNISIDLDGNPRPRGGGFDMGAYEFQGN